MKLLIFGSRDAANKDCQLEIERAVVNLKATEILTAAEPSGACEVARDYAKANGIPLTLFFKQRQRNAGMYHHRSVQAIDACDYAIFLWNGDSKGTANEIKICQKAGKAYEVINVSKDDDGWNLTEWDG